MLLMPDRYSRAGDRSDSVRKCTYFCVMSSGLSQITNATRCCRKDTGIDVHYSLCCFRLFRYLSVWYVVSVDPAKSSVASASSHYSFCLNGLYCPVLINTPKHCCRNEASLVMICLDNLVLFGPSFALLPINSMLKKNDKKPSCFCSLDIFNCSFYESVSWGVMSEIKFDRQKVKMSRICLKLGMDIHVFYNSTECKIDPVLLDSSIEIEDESLLGMYKCCQSGSYEYIYILQYISLYKYLADILGCPA